MYTAMVKDPFKKWDRVDTFCALLFDLGGKINMAHVPTKTIFETGDT